MNSTVLVDVSAYHKIKLGERGVNYGMKIVQTDWGYRCEGYALGGGVLLAEWFYDTDSFSDAVSDETKDYLYREMFGIVGNRLRALYRVAVANGIAGV